MKLKSKQPGTCYHCHEVIPAGLDLSIELEGQPQPMCCHGCAAVANMLANTRLSSFYTLRTAAAAKPQVRSEAWWRAFDDSQLLAQIAEDNGEYYSLPVNVSNLRCAACVWLLESCLGKLDGVEQIVLDFATGQGQLRWRKDTALLSDILIAADTLGYPLQPALLTTPAVQRQQERSSLKRLLVAALGMFQVMMISVGLYLGVADDMQLAERDFLRWIALLLATPVVWYSGWPFLHAAWQQCRMLRPGMDVPVSLAIGLAWLSSCIAVFTGRGEVYFDSAVMFIFFLTVSRHLEQRARRRAQAISERAAQLLPLMVRRLRPDRKSDIVQALQLQPGDCISVAAGETLAADGILTGSQTITVNESLLTGESEPITKTPDDPVLAGSQVLDAAATVTVTACGKETTLAAIQRLASSSIAQTDRFDWSARIAVWFTTVLLCLAAITAIWHWPAGWQYSLQTTLAVLVVSCPCALALAMPSVLASVQARLARQGILLRNAKALLRLPEVNHAVVDKTGTLTNGRFYLQRTIALADLSTDKLNRLATGLARHSHHPLASALHKYPCFTATAITETPGQGIEGQLDGKTCRLGKLSYVATLSGSSETAVRDSLKRPSITGSSELWIGDKHSVLGVLLLADTLKPEAAVHLNALMLPVSLLSGDTPAAVEATAGALGISDYRAQQLPADKLAAVQHLQQRNAVVMAVGDGINDAPLLAAADVGIAIGTRHSLAKSTADILVLHNDLDALPLLQKTARLVRLRSRQNISWALLYNLSVIPIAMLGWLPPWLAALGMSLSSLLVVGNSLRLKSIEHQPKSPHKHTADSRLPASPPLQGSL